MNILTFDLNLLRILDALLREQSTVKAGLRVHLSQPAVSSALRRLRDSLNDPLFVRQGQRLVPTEYARSLEIPLRRLLDELTDLLSGPRTFEPLHAQHNFKIAGSDFFGEMLMPPLASRLNRLAPNIQVQLVELVPGNHISTLEKHEIDMALIPMETFPGWVDSTAVFGAGFVVIAREDHPGLLEAGLEPGDTIPVDLFCELGHIVFSPEGKLRAMGDAALSRMGRERRVIMTMPAFGGICHAVSGSDLIALLPEPLAVEMARRLGLSIYSAPMPLDPAQIFMVWHRRNTGNPAHRWLRELIVEVLAPLDST
ncbi:MAG: LysR family transcriptional regulator, partial [Lysobacterales bacterium]